jgi:hypothetical protein
MSDDLRVLQYSFQSEILEKKKRESNPFILYRNSMKKTAPKNIKMSELSKMASESWKKLSDEEKTEWKRLYEVNRDLLPNNITDKKDFVEASETIVDHDKVEINSPIVQDSGYSAQYVHPISLFYKPPNDLCNFHIKVTQLLDEFNGNINLKQMIKKNPPNYYQGNEYIFFHQQNNRTYQIFCKIVSINIINFLNRNIYGIEIDIDQNIGQEHLTFTFDRKENLKRCLSLYLSHYLLN